MLTGVSLSEGGWRVRSNMLELTLGGGSGELCIQSLEVCAASAAQTPSNEADARMRRLVQHP